MTAPTDELLALLAKAAPLPWERGGSHGIAFDEATQTDFPIWEAGHVGDGDRRVACWIKKRETADLIIAAVNALPALLSREKALREALESCKQHLELCIDQWSPPRGSDSDDDLILKSMEASLAAACRALKPGAA